MPIKPRLFVPGCVHHVMARGLDGIDIFRDDADRETFFELYLLYHVKTGVRCYAWALMSNHYHFVIRTSDIPLSKLFAPLHTRYARYYNRKYSRRGYLFQDRFKSIAIQEQLYIEQLVRYVHLNPIRAGICKNIESLDQYPWTGHASIMGNKECRFLDDSAVLHRFNSRDGNARQEYRRFIAQGIDRQEADPVIELFRSGTQGGIDRKDRQKWVIGDPEFIKNALAQDRSRRIRLARYAAEGLTIEHVCRKIAGYYRVDPQRVRLRGVRGDCA
jgi:putative transposase